MKDVTLPAIGGGLVGLVLAGVILNFTAPVFSESDAELERRASAYYQCARQHPEALPDAIKACAECLLERERPTYAY